jgi:hypothetical protein
MASRIETGEKTGLIGKIALGIGTVGAVLALGGSIKSSLDTFDLYSKTTENYSSGNIIQGDKSKDEANRMIGTTFTELGIGAGLGIPSIIGLVINLRRNQSEIQS